MLPVGPEWPEWTVGFPAVKRLSLALVPALILSPACSLRAAATTPADRRQRRAAVVPRCGRDASAAPRGGGQGTRDEIAGAPPVTAAAAPKGTGPTWKGLYGSEVKLVDGTTVTADETYLKESITDPSVH